MELWSENIQYKISAYVMGITASFPAAQEAESPNENTGSFETTMAWI